MTNNRQTTAKQLFTEKQVYNNQFLTSEFIIEKKRLAIDGFRKEHSVIRLKGEYKKPTREQAQKMDKETLCLYIASSGLRLRDIKGAIENATYWHDRHSKEEILEAFFPTA